ncbi:Uma2 domain-containing protein [Gammaproteobacteria bacterium]
MRWEEVCADRSLQNLPYRIELNREGLIVMSPAKNRHAIRQGRILRILLRLMGDIGEAFPECPIETDDGTKVADVVWISPQRYAQVKNQDVCFIAPEICIEVISESNTEREMQFKTQLYLAAGAEEVWLCDATGALRFFSSEGQMVASRIVPSFPLAVPID